MFNLNSGIGGPVASWYDAIGHDDAASLFNHRSDIEAKLSQQIGQRFGVFFGSLLQVDICVEQLDPKLLSDHFITYVDDLFK
jgi:hypothetical protein